jgi:serpin B
MDAPWKYQFDPAATRKSPFTLLDGSTVMVDMMHFNEFLPSAAGAGWAAVELPYRGDELSMIAVVPENLAQFEAALSPALLGSIVGAIRDGGIHLSLPRFTFSFHASLAKAFEALGAPSLFTGPDLSGLYAGSGLFVSAIEHEAFVQVDEEGTKAAAATGVAIADSHGPTVSFDRPFMFFILDRPTGTVLFLGRVADPRAL